MKIKICGLFREQDIEFVNEARPDYAGFVFAKSKRQVSAPLAQYLRFRLANDITPVGVFINAPIDYIASLFHNGTISIAQLHGDEDESYITQLKRKCSVSGSSAQMPVIKAVKFTGTKKIQGSVFINSEVKNKNIDYLLVDSGKNLNWNQFKNLKISKPWFLSGGINLDNIKKAMALNPFAVDISGGAETDGFKDREKILQLTGLCRKTSQTGKSNDVSMSLSVAVYERKTRLSLSYDET